MSDDEQQPEDPPRRKRIRVPVGRRDMFGDYTDYAVVDTGAADHWDARIWNDRPL